ncbi:efflux RND transporter permease subunit [Marinitenerispora sediminis]|uniref:Hydrogenase expression protein n=1 Tax=Marinitenerispora sediminis TaxID=1931232 RepID=A0A368T7Q1_9ACTN|nr:efflux RND transporter permease subunit [Marinitenerispora sediminis]RCV52002.1 hydrogenase expression protein [Marinitenerispora sediminis]RCV56913.1 hydrogenase expression protein [Marinitenerispora sediminis]RCV60069.1 hydrogenase expression protein [Marinitenerispora sediminis]
MSRLAKMSLGNRALILLITLASVAFGLLATTSAKRELMPSLEIPMVTVNAQYQGASPQVVETEVTQTLEQAVRGVAGITSYTSTSSNGSASVVAEFDYGDETDSVIREVQQAVDRVQPALPDGVDPMVQAFSFDDIPVVMLAAGAGDGDAQALAEPLQEQVVPELESIDGVRAVTVTGVQESTITVAPDTGELRDAGLSVNDLTTALQSSGVLTPGGEITEDGRTLTVTTGGRLESVDDVADLWLMPSGAAAPGAPGGAAAAPEAVQLKDVADVELRLDDVSSITRTNGDPSLGVMITKTADGNTVDISNAVQDALDDLTPLLGEDADITVVFDQAPFINESIVAMAEEGALGLAFAVIVILVFLLSVRSTLVTAVSIPVSLLIAILAMQMFDYTLNILTLGALTVAIGRVVDDSIVVLENIKRHLGYGEEKDRAVFTGVREVSGAITSATLTTVAVFLPMGFVGGQVGELFRPFAVTVSVALGASLLVSLTIIPVLAYWFMRPKDVAPEDLERIRAEEYERELRTPLQRAYLPVIRWATRHRFLTLAVSLLLLAGTVGLATQLKTSFIDDQGQNTLAVSQELPLGTSLAEADAEAEKVEEKLAGLSWVESYQVSIGGGGGMGAMFGGGGAATSISYTLTTDPEGDQEEYRTRLRTALAEVDTEAEPRVDETGGMGGSTLEVRIEASDSETLAEAADEVEAAVRDIPGAADVTNSVAAAQPALEVRVDGGRAADEGLTEGQIGQAVTAAFQGTGVGTATVDDVERDIVVRVEDAPDSVAELEELEIATPTGGRVELSEVADVEEVLQAPELSRTDGVRSATVSATPTADDLSAVTADLAAALDELDLPEGATASIGGVSSDQTEAFGQLGLAMLAAVAIVYLVMVATFKSLIQPLILLVSIPFAATGALGLLFVTGTPLGIAAMIGLLMLIGVVVTNAIVLIDLINQYRAEGMELREAVVEGSRHRLRPILMTALATIGAMTPMALGITGGGAFISQPLALVVIGGLVTSTLLTLILVPVLYTMAEAGKERRAARREERRAARIEAARGEREDRAAEQV